MDLCASGLHPADNINSSGHCRGCRNIRERRARAVNRGEPLCWTAEHPEPAYGCICPCGEPPPPDTWEDWAAVENALAARWVPRRLTAAEELAAMRTVTLRYGGGMWEAASWINEHTHLHLSEKRVEYLLTKWAPRTGHKPRSVAELIDRGFRNADQATAPVETAA